MASFHGTTSNASYHDNVDDGTTLFLGDLSVYSTENHIRELFQSYGKIENIRIKRGNSTKPHLCYGFIKFDSKGSAEKALQTLNGVMFLGRTLRVGWAEKKSQNQQQQQQPQRQGTANGVANKGNTKGMETAQIHVSFISKQIDALISESTLRSLFGLYGEVVDVAIKKSQFDKKLKLQNGYGFVHYKLDEQGIQSAIQATSAIHQVTIDRVTYDCSLSHTLEVLMQQQGIQPPHTSNHEPNLNDQHDNDDDQEDQGIEEEEDVANLPQQSIADLSDPSLYIINQPIVSTTVTNPDDPANLAFPMLQVPVTEGGNGHYQIQSAQPNYLLGTQDLSATLEFFPKYPQPNEPFGFQPGVPPGALGSNPFQPSLSYAANPTYLNPNFQLGMFYPPGAPDFTSHIFASGSPMNGTSFYDDKMTGASFHLNKPFEGLGGLGGIGLGGFDNTHTQNGLVDYQNQTAAPFPSLHNPFQTTNFEPIMFPSLSNGVNEDISHQSQPGSNMHFNQQF